MKIEITPKRDIVFKRIFGTKGSEGILKDFLESILEMKIQSVSLDLATEILPEFETGKKTRIDVRTNLNDGTQVNVEMQIDTSAYSEKRCLEYWSRLYGNAIEAGEDYDVLRKTICIWILDGEVYEEFQKYHSKWKIQETELGLVGHFEEIEIHVIELSKFRRDAIIKPKKKEFWLSFIDYQNKEMVRMACEKNDKIAEAREILDKLHSDKEMMDLIRRQELYERDQIGALKRAKREGIEQGVKQEKRETAKKLKEMGMSISQISEITGLSEKEIKEL